MKTVTITKRDFDNATAVPWSTSTCVLAQTALRCGIDHNSTIAFASSEASKLRNDFDNLFRHKPPKLSSRAVKELRDRLPIKVKVRG